MKVKAFILAGGGGKRLFPLSTPEKPKPFINLIKNKPNLYQQTVARARKITDDITVITNKTQEHLLELPSRMERVLGEFSPKVLLETEAKNTAAPILWNAHKLFKNKRERNSIMVIFPSDHYIHDESFFTTDIKLACEHVRKNGGIALFGKETATYPSVYGYLECEATSSLVYNVTKFVEKPTKAQMADLLKNQKKEYKINLGIFVWRPVTIWALAQVYAPELTAPLDAEPTMSFAKYLEEVPNISIDFAVLNKVADTTLIKAFSQSGWGWYDVGSFDALQNMWDKGIPLEYEVICHLVKIHSDRGMERLEGMVKELKTKIK